VNLPTLVEAIQGNEGTKRLGASLPLAHHCHR